MHAAQQQPILQALWLSRQLCGCVQDVGVYVAPDVRQLELKVNNKERVWCGWEHFLGGPDNECAARIPPFGRTLVAVADHKDRSHFSAGRTRLLAYACSESPEPPPSSALAVQSPSAL